MSKKEFKFEDYIGHYVMHCPEKWQAEMFFEKMIKEKSDLWERFGLRIPLFNEWDRFKKETCYGFNDCTVGRKRNFIDYKVLEFDDFNWGEECDCAFNTIVLSLILELQQTHKKEIIEDGFCPCCGKEVTMCKFSDKRFMRCKHCNKDFCVSEE